MEEPHTSFECYQMFTKELNVLKCNQRIYCAGISPVQCFRGGALCVTGHHDSAAQSHHNGILCFPHHVVVFKRDFYGYFASPLSRENDLWFCNNRCWMTCLKTGEHFFFFFFFLNSILYGSSVLDFILLQQQKDDG